VRLSVPQHTGYVLFFASLLYVGATLPCGRFYYEGVEGFFGNSVLRASYQFLYIYMALFIPLSDSFERWFLALVAKQQRRHETLVDLVVAGS
jgi:hypothetical protein